MCSWIPLNNYGSARKEPAKKGELRDWDEQGRKVDMQYPTYLCTTL